MVFLEKELEDLIFGMLEDNQNRDLVDRGLNDIDTYGKKKYYRQVQLGSYGVADIIAVACFENDYGFIDVYFDIIELKKDIIDSKTLEQAARYYIGFKEILNQRFGDNLGAVDGHIILIGTEIRKNTSFVYLTDVFKNISLYTAEFDPMKGIYFDSHNGYTISKPNLPKKCIDFNIIKESND